MSNAQVYRLEALPLLPGVDQNRQYELLPEDPKFVAWAKELKRERQLRNLSDKLQGYINTMVYVSVVFLLLDKLF